MLRRDRMLVLSAMLIGVAWCGLARAQESTPSGGADREIQIRDRYEQVLATDPMRDPAFDRTYDAYLALEGIDAWVEKLQAPAATEAEARARLVLLGRIASRRFRSRDAVTYLEQAREQGTTGPPFQVLLGKEYARVGRDDEAIAELTAAVEALTDPAERADVCRALGSLLLRRGREAEAIATWERIAEGEGADALALAELAEIYEDNRRWDEAIGAYRRMLDASAGDPYRACRALRAIGRCQEQLDRMPEAVATYEQALSLAAPGNWMYEDLKRRLVAAYDRMGDLDGLSRYLEARIASAPADLDTRELLADTYRRLGRIDEAEAAYREALARDPKRIATYERLIALYASQGRTGDEAAAYAELIAAYPSDLDYVRRLGEAHLRAGDAVSAKAAWERINLPQATPERLALLATWLERYEFPDEAIAAYEQALQMRSDREWVLRLAGLKHQRGVTEEARVLWLSAAGAEATAEEVAEIAAILSGHDLTADATALWRRAAALEPTSDAYRLSLARSLAEGEAYEEATALFEALAREAQSDLHRGQAEQGLTDAYAEMGVLEAKQAEWEAAAAASPEDVDLQMRLARLYDRGGDVYRGLAVVEACAAIRPDDPALLRELARRYRRARRIDQSIAAYTRLIETDRTRALAYLKELLQVYRDAGDSKGAVATAQRLVEQNPTNPEARALLAQTYEQARDQAAAAAEYRAAVRLDPTEPAYLRGYAQALLNAGQWGEAGDAARRMLDAATARETRLEAISVLTQVHQRQGALDALLRELEERVRTTPADFAAYEELAAAYRYAGQPARALEVMSGALDQVDNRQEALRTLIRESFDALAFDKVLGFYEELLAIAGNLTPEEYERIGRVYAQLGHPDRALEIWNRIVEEDPGNPKAYERLARILALEGRVEASLTARERALELDPYNHAMRYELAVLLAGVEQTDRAMAQAEMIVELGPSPEELAAEEAVAAPPVSGLPPGMVSSGSRPLPGAMMMPPAGAPYADYRGAAIGLLLNLAKAADGAEDVIARFREKAEEEPDNIQAQLDLMRVCGQPEEALDIGLALLERVPDDLSLARRVMELLFDQQRTDEALALAEKLAERFPEQRRDLRLSLYHRLGRMNRGEEARALLDELVAEYPDDRSFVQIAIHARAAEGDADGAMALAESFVAAHPDEAETIRRVAAKALEDAAPERAMDLYEALLFDTELPPVGQFRGRAPSQGVYMVARLGDASPRSSVSNLLMSMPTVAEAVRVSSPQASACEALTGPDAPPERRAAALARIEAEAAKLAEAETTEAYDRALAFCALRALVHLVDGEIAEARRWLAPFLSDARPTLEAANLELYLLDVEGRYEDMAQRYAALRRAFPGLEQSLLPAEASAWRLAQNGEAAAEAIIASLAGVSAPGVFLEQIRTLRHLGRASDARRLLEGFLSETNRNPDALALLAGMYHKEGDTRRAIELVREAYLAQAQRGGMQGWGASGYAGPGMGFGTMSGLGSVVWPTGLSSGTPLPGFHPGPAGRGATRQPSELLRLWHTYAMELNETAEMVAEFEERLRQQPNAIQAHVEMAHVYRLEERYEDVIAVYRRLIERQPTYHAARQALAEVLVERNEITEAIEVYEQLMQVHPAGRRMYRTPLRTLYRRVGEEARVEELDRAAMQRATTPQEALTLAQEFRATGDLAQAEELYRRALRMDPTQPHVHRELAQVLRQEGKLEEALEVNRAYLANPAFSPGAGFDLSAVGEMVSLSRELGRLAELTAEQEAALAADPENAQAKYFLACLAQDAGDLSRALSLLRELDTDGRFAHAIVNVLEMSGDTAGLYAYLKEQAEAPGRGYADYRRLARCAMAMGDRAGAVHWIEENARQQGGGRPDPRYVLDELVAVGLFDEAERFYLEQRPTAARDANRLENFDRIALRGWSEYGRFDAALRTVLSSGEHGPVDPLIERLCSSGGGSGARRAEMLAFLEERYADRTDVLRGMYQSALNANDDAAAIALLKRLLDVEPENEEYIGRYTDLLNRNAAERELIAWYEARAEADWTVGSVSQLARHLREKGYVKRYEALKARAIEAATEEERARFAQAFADIEAPPASPQVAPYQFMPGMPVALPPEALAQMPPGTAGSPIEVMKAAIRANPSAAMLEQFMMQLASFQQDRVAYELFKEFRDEPFMADWKVTNDQWLHVLLRFGDDADRRMVYEHVYATATAPEGHPGFAMGSPPGIARLYLIPQYLPPNHHAGFAAFLDAKLAELEGPSREQCMQFAQLYGAVQAHDRVLELTDRVIADGWGHAEVIRMRASALGSLGRHDEQIAALDGLRARASAGERGGVALEIARAMIAAGRPGEADEVVAAAVTEDRSPNLALTAGQYFLDERKNPEAALPLLEKACADPDRAESAAHPLARCYAELGRTSDAAAVAERYPRLIGYGPDLSKLLVEHGDVDAAERLLSLATDANQMQTEAFRAVFGAMLEQGAFDRAVQLGERVAAMQRSEHHKRQTTRSAAGALLDTGTIDAWLGSLSDAPGAFAVHTAARLMEEDGRRLERPAALTELVRAHVDVLVQEQEGAARFAESVRETAPDLALAVVRALLAQPYIRQSATNSIWTTVLNAHTAEGVDLTLTALDRTPSRVASSWDTVRFVAEHGTDEQVARLREIYTEFYTHAAQLSLFDGHVLFLRGEYEAGLDAIEAGCAGPDVTASELRQAAELLDAEGRLDAADAAYARVRTADPARNIYGLSADVHGARMARLRLAWRRGDADGVRALFAEAAAEAPGGEADDATVMMTAQALGNLGLREEARRLVDERFTGRAGAMVLMQAQGLGFLGYLGGQGLAEQVLRRILENAPDSQHLLGASHMLPGAGSSEFALEAFRRAGVAPPWHMAHLTQMMGQRFIEAGLPEEAIALYAEQVRVADPMRGGPTPSVQERVAAYAAAGRIDALLAEADATLATRPGDLNALLTRAHALVQMRRIAEGVEFAAKAMENGASPTSTREFAAAALHLEDPGAVADRLAAQLANAETTEYTDADAIAQLRLAAGDAAGAVALMRPLAPQAKWTGSARQGLERLAALDRWEEAARWYATARRAMAETGSDAYDLDRLVLRAIEDGHLGPETFQAVLDAEASAPTSAASLRAVKQHYQGDLEGAMGWIRPLLEAHPDAAGLHRTAAELHRDNGDPQSAVAHYERTIALDAAKPEGVRALAELLMAAGMEERALTLLRDRLGETPTPEDVAYFAGQLARAHRAGEALALADRDWGHLRPSLRRGLRLTLLETARPLTGPYPAMAAFQDARAAGGDERFASRYLSHLWDTGRLVEARRELDDGLYQLSLRMMTPGPAAQTYARHGRMDEAADIVLSALFAGTPYPMQYGWFGPHFGAPGYPSPFVAPMPYAMMGIPSAMGMPAGIGPFHAPMMPDIPGALEPFGVWSRRLARRVVEETPGVADRFQRRVHLALLAGDAAMRLRAADEALAERPHWPAALETRAMALGELGRHVEAAEAWRRLTGMRPLALEGVREVAVARALFAAGEREEAQAELAAVRAWSHDASTRAQMGDLLLEYGEAAEAEAEYRLALRRDPTQVGAVAGLAGLCLSDGRTDEGMALWRRLPHDGAPSRRSVAARLREQGQADAALPLYAALLAQRPGAPQGLTDLLSTAGPVGDGAWGRVLDAMATAVGRTRGARRDDLQRAFGAWCARTGRIDALIAAVSAEGGAHAALAASVAEAVRAASEETSDGGSVAGWLDAAEALAIDTVAGQLALGDAATRIGDAERAARRLQQAAAHGDATLGQRRAAAVGLLAAGRAREALAVFDTLLNDQPNLYMRDTDALRAAALAEDAEALARRLDACRPYLANDTQAAFLRAHADWLGDRREAALAGWKPLVDARDLTGDQVCVMADCFDEAGRPEPAVRVHAQLAAGGYGNAQAAASLARLIEAAAQAGDLEQAVAMYARLAPLNARRAADVAGAIVDATTAERLPELRAALAAVIQTDPANNRVSECAALYAHAAQGHGESVTAAAFAAELGASAFEMEEAAYWDGAFQGWRVTPAADAFDDAGLDALRELLASDAAYVPDAKDVITLTPLPDAMTAGAPTGSAFVASTTVHVDVAGRRTLQVLAPGPAAVRVNGRPVQVPARVYGAGFDAFLIEADLVAGENALLLMVQPVQAIPYFAVGFVPESL